MSKIGDIAVRIGTYTTNGQEKGRYATIGAFMQGADGSFFGSVHPYVDLPTLHQLQRADCRARNKELRDTVAVTVFAERAAGFGVASQPAAPATSFADLEEVPF